MDFNKRLTEYNNKQEVLDDDMTISDILGNLSLSQLENMYFKLAAYENIGLTPEEITDLLSEHDH